MQVWVGESPVQGKWIPVIGQIERDRNSWRLAMSLSDNPDLKQGVRKLRWIMPASSSSARVKRLTAFTHSRWSTTSLRLQLEKPVLGKAADIELYNGAFIGTGSSLHSKWNLSSPLSVKLKYSRPRVGEANRTVLRLRLPSGDLAVAVDDVLDNGSVYVRDAGLYIASEPVEVSLAGYLKRIADKKTVLERVREMPDQTFAQAMARTHNPVQKNGPMILSLACDNHKFISHRDGAVQFSTDPEDADRYVSYPEDYKGMLQPRFGSGKNEDLTRSLYGGWLPVPVISVDEGGVVYTERAYAAPYGEAGPAMPDFLNRRSLCVAEFTVQNNSSQAEEASLVLGFAVPDQNASLRQEANGIVVERDGRPLACLDTSGRGPLHVEAQGGALTLKGTLPAGSSAGCVVYIPAWRMKAEETAGFGNAPALLAGTETYWKSILARATQIEVPDQQIANVIRASQVHCLLAARNEGNGKHVAPWIGGMAYGPLESESNSIIRGMDLLGHHDFARRSLEYFISRYNKEGFLTTGYTLMGTGWHLWTLGEHYQLTQDDRWMKQVAPEVDRVCNWVAAQREKTKKLDAGGAKVPEYGLMPPGVMADWNAFAYYFCLNGYYYAGLNAAAHALASIGYPGAGGLVKNAADFRSEILRAYKWTQAQTPILPLADGTWIPAYPSQIHVPGKTGDFFPGEDGNRSWCYDIELGAHQLVPQGVLDPKSKDVTQMVDNMEDIQFLSDGWFDYPAERSQKDWFDLGGFSKVQPYYCRNAEIYAMRDDVKPFVRTYFNTLAAMLNPENLSLWEHFKNTGAWNKTHETGYFLQQTRFMLLMEHGNELWLAPLITNNWLKDGMTVSVKNAPSRFGNVSYKIISHASKGYIEAEIEAPETPSAVVVRLRHPEGKPMKEVKINGVAKGFDVDGDTIRFRPAAGTVTVRAEY